MGKENWKEILNGKYFISDRGRLKKIVLINGKIKLFFPKRTGYANGYLGYNFYFGHTSRRSVHSLVAEAFIGPRPNGYQVNHKNGIKTDNRLENLEYVTCSENVRHSMKIGTTPLGQDRCNSKLRNTDVIKIRNVCSRGRFQKVMAEKYGVSRSVINNVVLGRTYKSV